MEKNYWKIGLLILFINYSNAQIIISNSLVRSMVGGADNDIKKVLGFIGSGSMYNQASADKNVAASGGFVFAVPFGTHVKEGKFKAISITSKYNIGALKSFTLKDSLFNLNNIANSISRQIFSYDNGNNFNFGGKLHFLGRNDDGRLSNLNFFIDCNFTDYKINLDTSNYSALSDTFSKRNLKLSNGFSLVNPLAGINFDWSHNLGNQYFGINFSAAFSASFIYEKEVGKDYVGSWAYTLFNNQALDKNFNLSNKINSFYSAFGRLNIFINDINIFIVVQKNFVGFSSSQLELQGVNNRNLFINWGVNFSPSLLHFDFR